MRGGRWRRDEEAAKVRENGEVSIDKCVSERTRTNQRHLRLDTLVRPVPLQSPRPPSSTKR